ncbi:AAA family ATPase [Trebonia sp.]|uniref:AAA family ATPase n=1 Tax=Trebonia sp. TaxID=2767075 RepID=UPI00261A5998|nr:AAA family ATPase [Trebonia sp.]
MTTRFRIEAVLLNTTEGDVLYDFPSDLTVLAGKTGVGKTTLLELIKFGFGGNAVLADVAREHVNYVTLNVALGESRLQISRSIDPVKRNLARVTDLKTLERLPDHRVANGHPSLNTLLMAALGLPDDMRAPARTGSSSRPGSRISFSDIFSFLYIPQSAINRDIAHSQESYREPTRKTVFELLFGLTDAEIQALRSRFNALNGQINDAEKEYIAIVSFLRTSNTTGREEAELLLSDAVANQAAAEAELVVLREEIDPVADRETQALRDLLTEAERSLADARGMVTELGRQQVEYTNERHRVQTDLARLHRMREAGERLANIEFAVCPRCMQSLISLFREIPEGCCRVCLQPDPVLPEDAIYSEQYEFSQLADQLQEMDDQLYAIAQQLTVAMQAATDREQLVQGLTAKIDTRTSERVTPRLQAYSDAVARFSAARVQQEQFELILRQWDRADDLGARVRGLRAEREAVRASIEKSLNELSQRRREVLDNLNEEFHDTVMTLGIPGVQSAAISPTTYLPLLDDQSYTTFSPPGGGIVTATQVAYWTSLLAVALRDPQSIYPAFLMLDTPRLAVNTSEELAAALYRRLVQQAGTEPGRVQLIIADNELPAEYRRNYPEIVFTYDSPTISTVRHPGPTRVRTIGDIPDSEPDRNSRSNTRRLGRARL